MTVVPTQYVYYVYLSCDVSLVHSNQNNVNTWIDKRSSHIVQDLDAASSIVNANITSLWLLRDVCRQHYACT
jgi:hypothetical protein